MCGRERSRRRGGGGFHDTNSRHGFYAEGQLCCVVLCYVFVYKFKSGSPELHSALMNVTTGAKCVGG